MICNVAILATEPHRQIQEAEEQEMTEIDLELGLCCGCEAEEAAQMVLLPLRAPVAGSGWACSTCKLPPDGAVAVLCDGCTERAMREDGCLHFLKSVVYGLTTRRERLPVSELERERFDHDAGLHAAANFSLN